MLQSPDFRELLSVMAAREARFLVIGGYAVMLYGEPRFTKDLALWIDLSESNAAAVFAALRDFGAPMAGLTAADFAAPGFFYQMGRPPLRVDLMMSVPGVAFAAAWGRRNVVLVDGLSVPFVSRDDLIALKLAAGRDQDLRDVEALRSADGDVSEPIDGDG